MGGRVCKTSPRCLARLDSRHAVRGLSLLDLMVGLTIGLVVSVAAMGVWVFAAGVGRAQAEATRMQQDASLVFGLVGQFVRSAGAVDLVEAAGAITLVPRTAFDGLPGSPGVVVQGLDATTVQMVTALPTASGGHRGQVWDCLGRSVAGTYLVTQLSWAGDSVRCVGLVDGETSPPLTPQPLIGHVDQFVVHYAVRVAGTDTTQYVPFGPTVAWRDVVGLRVCMVLRSSIAMPEFADVYTDTPTLRFDDCNGADMATSIRSDKRMRRLYRQLFVLRPGEGA